MSNGWTLDRFAGRAGFDVVLADDDETADLVFRFRYHVYVTLMGRRQLYADHARRTVREPLDERGQNYVALRNGAAIGTIRRNTLDDPAVAYYAKVYRAHLFEPTPTDRISITTKLMMLPDHQHSIYLIRLVEKFAKLEYQQGIRINVIDCNKPLIDLFERMGYFSYVGWVFHKEFGTVMPMFFSSDARVYLSDIRSVLHCAGEEIVSDGCYGGYDLIRRLAEPPRNARIRALSEPFRTTPHAQGRTTLGVDPLRHHLRIDPAAGRGDAEAPGAEAI